MARLLAKYEVEIDTKVRLITLWFIHYGVRYSQAAHRAATRRADDLLQESRILLLEEGHCFRDHALEVCEMHRRGEIDTLGASSLATIVRMVANGMGVTLLPKISVDTETRGLDLRLLDFPDPAPSRSIGLAWRKSSPRKRDFEEVGNMIRRAVR